MKANGEWTSAVRPTLGELRESRFSNGVACVYCKGCHIQRWGSFSGRQRYRCVACKRTFSDLTLTPLAYSKLPWLWGAFGGCMLDSLTVRAAAARLGIHKDTAWRWRHCLLEAHRRLRTPALRGIIEVTETSLFVGGRSAQPICGARWLPRSGRRRVALLVARDRIGNVHTAVASGRRPTLKDLRRTIGRSRARGRLLLGREGRYGATAQYALIAGAGFRRVPAGGLPLRDTTFEHLHNAFEYSVRLRDWLARFRGIAAKYLARYLAWHLVVDRWLASATTLILVSIQVPARLPK